MRPASPDQLEYLANEPVVDGGIRMISYAYSRLSTNKGLGYGVLGPIPDSKITEWCERRGYDADVSDWFASVIQHIDSDAMQRQAAEQSTPKRKNRR